MENENIVQKFEQGMPTTKAQVTDIAFDLINKLDNGEISALQLLRNFKMIEKIQEQVKESLMRAALNEADKNPGKEFEAHGVSFTKMEAATKYDYSKCGDEQYVAILSTEEKLKKEKTAREAFLKSIQGQFDLVDTDSGEIVATLYPPTKTSTSTLQVKIK